MHKGLVVYTYKNCDTCRRAVKWLRAAGYSFEERPLRETPPSVPELLAMLKILGGERRRLCNTAGAAYREQKFGEVLDLLSEPDFLDRLAANGNLIKRPFLLGLAPLPMGLVGFSTEVWENYPPLEFYAKPRL